MKRVGTVVIGGLMMSCGLPPSWPPVRPIESASTRSIEMTVMAEVPPEEAFSLWSTPEGAKMFFAPAADIGGAVGDSYVIAFDPDNDPEGAHHGTKGARIREFEPGKRIVFGWTFPPFGPEFNTEPFRTWVEIEVEAFPGNPAHSLVHFAHRGFPVESSWDRVFSLFRDGNWPLVLNRFLVYCRDGFSPEWEDAEGEKVSNVLLKETIVGAPVEQVWKAWTTVEGLEGFLGERAVVEPRPGGAYEILFSMAAPEGDRGGEGCLVVAVEPARRLTFTWNSPPSLPEIRIRRTNVIIDLTPEDGGWTKVRLLALGWGVGEAWEESYAYFDGAWSKVLEWLEASFKMEPVAGTEGSSKEVPATR